MPESLFYEVGLSYVCDNGIGGVLRGHVADIMPEELQVVLADSVSRRAGRPPATLALCRG